MKIIIAGGRDFNDYQKLKFVCDHLLRNRNTDPIEIVSGCAKGADTLGSKYAKENGFKLTEFPADWDKYKKAAGYIRNKEMAEYADVLIAFWDNKSRGTEHMINLAKENNLKISIHEY